MKKVICVSFPRSGHHLITNVLLKYYSKDIDYPKTDGMKSHKLKKVIRAGDFNYCEFYNHCQNFPCTNSKTNFQKNHDFDLKLKILPEFRYLITYRNPIESIVSLYMYYLRNPRESDFLGIPVEDSAEGWKFFALKIMIFWKGFVKKWIAENNPKNSLVISYEEILQSPFSTFVNILKLLEPNKKIDSVFLKEILSKESISNKSHLKDFKYFNKRFFAELEKTVADEMNYAGMEQKFNKPNIKRG